VLSTVALVSVLALSVNGGGASLPQLSAYPDVPAAAYTALGMFLNLAGTTDTKNNGKTFTFNATTVSSGFDTSYATDLHSAVWAYTNSTTSNKYTWVQ